MTKLTYSGEIREEVDESVIQTLVRKGWAIIPEPPKMPDYPVFDQAIYKATYNVNTNLYEIIELTAEEIQTRTEVEANMQAMMQRAAARQLITDQIDAGYDVQPEDFVLGLSEYDRTAFTQMLLLVREALDLGLISNSDSQTISDKTGEKHSLTTERFRQIMVSYGLFYKSLWDQLS